MSHAIQGQPDGWIIVTSSDKTWLPFPSPGDLLDPGSEPGSPALQVDSLPSKPPGKP